MSTRKKTKKKRKKRKSPRKRKYSALTLTQVPNEPNTSIIRARSPLKPDTKRRKLDTCAIANTNVTENGNICRNNSSHTNATVINTNQTNDSEMEEITQFDNEEFSYQCTQTSNNFNFDLNFNQTNTCNNDPILDENDTDFISFVYTQRNAKNQNKQSQEMKAEKEAIMIPNDYEIDYSLIGGVDEISACKYIENMIRCEQRKQYKSYTKHLQKLNTDLNNKNKRNEVFQWRLTEYKNDDKQVIILDKINANKKYKQSQLQMQKEVLLFCSCSFSHDIVNVTQNKFENILANGQVLYGKIIDIQNTPNPSITLRIKKYHKTLDEYDVNYVCGNNNELPFHDKQSCAFRVELDEYLFATFSLQLKAIETFFSSTTIQLGQKWCNKYYYICHNNNVDSDSDIEPLIPMNEILNAMKACQLVKALSVPTDLATLIATFVGESDEYMQIKQLNHVMNDSQIKAIYNAYSYPVSLIQGPPGTGKTFTAVHIVKQLLSKSANRILLTAHTHAACDQLLSELHSFYEDNSNVSITRFSNESQIKIFELEKYSYRQKMRKHREYNNMRSWYKASRNRRHSFEERQQLLKNARALEFTIIYEVLCESNIIVSTCFGCGKSVFAKTDISFGAIIVDEATQIIESEMLGVINLFQRGRARIEDIKSRKRENLSGNGTHSPFYTYIKPISNFNKQLIMIGDPQQLSPVIRSKEAYKLGHSITLFDRLLKRTSISQLIQFGHQSSGSHNPDYAPNNFIMLNKQYRGYELCGHHFCSQQFYNGQLQHHRVWGKSNPQQLIGGFEWRNHKPFNFVTLNSKQKSVGENYNNEIEAKCVIGIVKRIMDYGLNPNTPNTESIIKINKFEDIGIITPHKEQSYLLKSKLAKMYDWNAANMMAVSTVDAFQGQQKKLIIYSMTRTDAVCNLFTTNYKRINVSLTRAKFGLIIVGNPVQFGGYKVWKELKTYLSDNDMIQKSIY